MTNNPQKSILRLKDVEKKVGLKRSTIYELMESGDFPQSIRLGLRAVGWLEEEVDLWIFKRTQKRDAEIARMAA